MIKNKKVFSFKDPETETISEVKAGGAMPYIYDLTNKDLSFLMIVDGDKYCDFGGKIDPKDANIQETISREVFEESNGIFKKRYILDKIKKLDGIYSQHSKYLLYLFEADKYYDPKQFGKIEFHDNIPRTVEWVTFSNLMKFEFLQNKLHARLKYKNFFKEIKKINSDLKT